MKVFLYSFVGFLVLLVATATTSNPISNRVKEEARAKGYLEYTPLEAKKMAEIRCSQCHQLERIAKYCRRCGPPFVVVMTHMERLMSQHQSRNPKKEILGLTKHQEVAVVQVWNAMVGNWESDFRREDLVSMIGERNDHLLALLDTPIDKRPIESGLMKSGQRLKGVYEEEGVGKAQKAIPAEGENSQ